MEVFTIPVCTYIYIPLVYVCVLDVKEDVLTLILLTITIAPIITILMSSVFLGEIVTTLEACSAVITLLGAILVTNPGLESPDKMTRGYLLGCIFSLLNGVFNAAGTICRRWMGTNVHFMIVTMWMGFGSIFMGISMASVMNDYVPSLINSISSFYSKGVRLALLSGLLGFIGQCFLAEGFQYARAGPGSVVQSADLPMVYIFAIVFLGEYPSVVRIIGSLLVVVAALIVTFEALHKESEAERNALISS